jgi:hypothetical protein
VEIQAYAMIKKVHDLVTNDRKMLTTNEINYISGILETLLTLYSDDQQPPAPAEMTEARRPPAKPQRKHWYQWLFG